MTRIHLLHGHHYRDRLASTFSIGAGTGILAGRKSDTAMGAPPTHAGWSAPPAMEPSPLWLETELFARTYNSYTLAIVRYPVPRSCCDGRILRERAWLFRVEELAVGDTLRQFSVGSVPSSGWDVIQSGRVIFPGLG